MSPHGLLACSPATVLASPPYEPVHKSPPPCLLEIRDLTIGFEAHGGPTLVVDGVSLSVPQGTAVALVGESGCGKSLTALSILRLIPLPGRILSGQILFRDDLERAAAPPAAEPCHASTDPYRRPRLPARNDRHSERSEESPARRSGKALEMLRCAQHDVGFDMDRKTESRGFSRDLLKLKPRELRAVRGDRIGMIFQEPMTALHPVYTIGEQIAEGILLHRRVSKRAAWEKAVDLLDQVSQPEPRRVADCYPHELSGGMRQRAMIAMALCFDPMLLIADEPTTALDTTTQREILDLLRGLQRSRGLSLLLITHDLGVVEEVADAVYVMYAGRIVEHAPTAQLFANPLHPYTQGLLECTPRLGTPAGRFATIPGTVPLPGHWPHGCRFHPRCDLTKQRAEHRGQDGCINLPLIGRVLRQCVDEAPPLYPASDSPNGTILDHRASCWEHDPSTEAAASQAPLRTRA